VIVVDFEQATVGDGDAAAGTDPDQPRSSVDFLICRSHQSSHAAADHRMSAHVVEERIDHVPRRCSICDLLDRNCDRKGHDEHDKHGDAEIKRLAYAANSRRLSHRENLLGQFLIAIVSFRQP
jgi:hypothetical protein